MADEEAERQLKARLSGLVPGALFVGEEEFSGGADLVAALAHERVWLVDPLDGTANFIAGSTQWAMMVALVAGGKTSAAWIWQPVARICIRRSRVPAPRGTGRPSSGDGVHRWRQSSGVPS